MPTAHKIFVWDCGHNFVWDIEEFERYEAQMRQLCPEGITRGVCLDCLYPVHAPIKGRCEVCGKVIAVTIGEDMVCDECMPAALVTSLHKIVLSAKVNIDRN